MSNDLQTVYQQLKAIVAMDKSILVYYKEDLTIHDLKTLRFSKAGQEYIRGVRESGTHLYFTNTYGEQPKDPAATLLSIELDINYYRCRLERCDRFFHIKITGDRGYGEIKEISLKESMAFFTDYYQRIKCLCDAAQAKTRSH
ncbi:MAG: hypothetical protein WBB28_01870 [Crinalium sp.]